MEIMMTLGIYSLYSSALFSQSAVIGLIINLLKGFLTKTAHVINAEEEDAHLYPKRGYCFLQMMSVLSCQTTGSALVVVDVLVFSSDGLLLFLFLFPASVKGFCLCVC